MNRCNDITKKAVSGRKQESDENKEEDSPQRSHIVAFLDPPKAFVIISYA
jgi:hypothetical protein